MSEFYTYNKYIIIYIIIDFIIIWLYARIMSQCKHQKNSKYYARPIIAKPMLIKTYSLINTQIFNVLMSYKRRSIRKRH